MSSLKIEPEFKTLIPPLADDEYRELEASILAEGCRDALVIWNGVIVDGHNRYEICRRHDLNFSVNPMEFADREQVKVWIIGNQFARRNIDKVQRSRLALTMEGIIAAKAKERQISTLKQNAVYPIFDKREDYNKNDISHKTPVPQISAERSPIETRDELAKIAQVSHDTIHKVKTVDNTAPPPIKQAMTDKVLSINQAYQATKLPAPEQDNIVKAIQEGGDVRGAVMAGFKNSPEGKRHAIKSRISKLWGTIVCISEDDPEFWEAWFSLTNKIEMDNQEDMMRHSINKINRLLLRYQEERKERSKMRVVQ